MKGFRRLANACVTLTLALSQSLPASAADLHERIQSCARITNNGQRLACFDELAAEPSSSHVPTTSAPSVANVPPAVPPSADLPATALPTSGGNKEATFGLEQQLLRQWQAGPSTVSEIRAAVRKLGSGPNGWLIIELDNGQTWGQAEAPQFQILLGVGDEVTIRRGALGSFLLSTADNRSMRVRRKN